MKKEEFMKIKEISENILKVLKDINEFPEVFLKVVDKSPEVSFKDIYKFLEDLSKDINNPFGSLFGDKYQSVDKEDLKLVESKLFTILRNIVNKLIDEGDKEDIEEILKKSKEIK